MNIASIWYESMKRMKVTSRHMCFTPKCLENSKRGDYVLTWDCLEVVEQPPSNARRSRNQTAPIKASTLITGPIGGSGSTRVRKPNKCGNLCNMV